MEGPDDGELLSGPEPVGEQDQIVAEPASRRDEHALGAGIPGSMGEGLPGGEIPVVEE